MSWLTNLGFAVEVLFNDKGTYPAIAMQAAPNNLKKLRDQMATLQTQCLASILDQI